MEWVVAGGIEVSTKCRLMVYDVEVAMHGAQSLLFDYLQRRDVVIGGLICRNEFRPVTRTEVIKTGVPDRVENMSGFATEALKYLRDAISEA